MPSSADRRAVHGPVGGFLPNVPRPLRFRGEFSWGRADATEAEALRLKSANVLLVNFLGLCEIIHGVGGLFLFEHPADPGVEPYPSSFATELVQGWLRRTAASRVRLCQ